MKGLLKFLGGAVLGAAIGAGAYLLLTNEDEQGIIHDLKSLINESIDEGKRAAVERRQQLQSELEISKPRLSETDRTS